MCFVYPQKPSIGLWQGFSAFERRSEPAADKRIDNLSSHRHQQEKGALLVYAVCKRHLAFFTDILFHV